VSVAHAGSVLAVDIPTSGVRELVTGLQAPHGFVPLGDGRILGADTRRGRAIVIGTDGLPTDQFLLEGLGEKSGRERSGTEWLQKAVPFPGGIIMIDEARDRLWLVSTLRKRYRGIALPPNWRVHTVTVDSNEPAL
jgi:hypothetical protein